jgi:hypothetical protein
VIHTLVIIPGFLEEDGLKIYTPSFFRYAWV